MKAEELVKTNADFLVTETTIDPKIPVEKIVQTLREWKTTGQFVVHLSEGGIQKVSLTEKTRTAIDQSAKIRRLMGWEENGH